MASAKAVVLGKSGKADLPKELFAEPFHQSLVHEAARADMAARRRGTASTLTRGEVAFTTAKAWRQKGTGRARAGMTSSPLWRGGGRTFPNSPDENFTQKINKKMYRAGMASIFSQLAREGRLAVVESMKVDSPKTKQLAARFKAMNLGASVLVIAEEVDENLYLLAQPVNVLVVEPRYADPHVAGALQEGAGHQGAIDSSRRCSHEPHQSDSAARKFDEGRLMKVLVARSSPKRRRSGRQDQRGHLQGAAGRHQPRSRPR